MLHAFSTNRVKLVARKPKPTDNLGQREYKLVPAKVLRYIIYEADHQN